MRNRPRLRAIVITCLLLLAGCSSSEGDPAATVAADPERAAPSPTPTAAPEPTPTPAATPLPTATPAPTAEPQPSSDPTHQVSGIEDALNLRSGPSEDSGLLGAIPPGAEVEVTGPDDAGWTRVTYDGVSGWVWGGFLSPLADEAQPPTDAAQWRIANVDTGVNVRSGPDGETDLVGTIALGEVVTPTGGTDGNWIEVTYGTLSGWVWGEFVETPGGTAPTPSEPVYFADSIWQVANVQDAVNLRDGPGLDADVQRQVPLDHPVTATGNTTEGWVEVSYVGLTGWIAVELLAPVRPG